MSYILERTKKETEICTLFKDILSRSENIALNDWINLYLFSYLLRPFVYLITSNDWLKNEL
jgi:hypothetical protein